MDIKVSLRVIAKNNSKQRYASSASLSPSAGDGLDCLVSMMCATTSHGSTIPLSALCRNRKAAVAREFFRDCPCPPSDYEASALLGMNDVVW